MMSSLSRSLDNIMWIEVKEGTSEAAQDDTFWNNIVKNISKVSRTISMSEIIIILFIVRAWIVQLGQHQLKSCSQGNQ